MKLLNIHDNRLQELPEEFREFTEFTRLILDHNEFSDFPNSIGKLTNLNKLNMTHNYLSELSENFSDLINLEVLFLNRNDFSVFPNFSGNTKLELISMPSNKLTSFSVGNLINLKEIILNNKKFNIHQYLHYIYLIIFKD